MLNIEKLTDDISEVPFSIPNSKKVTIDISYYQFTFKNINTLMGKIKYLATQKEDIKKIRIKAHINSFPDIATIIYFNLIIAYILIKFADLYPAISSNDIIISKSITNNIINKTPLAQFLARKISREEFINICLSGENFANIHDNFFWKVIDYNENQYNNHACLTLDSIRNFLNYYSQDTTFNYHTLIIIDELINNALEHSKASVLVYLNIKDLYNSETNEPYLLFSICILCLSDIPIYYDISNKLNCHSIASKEIVHAFEEQQSLFTDEYNIKHFAMIAAMQNNVTGRDNQTNGGTGLPNFLKKIQGKLYWYKSYLISNDICMYFDDKYTKENPLSGLYGFNQENDLNHLPDPAIFDNPCYSVSGVLYNLMLVKHGGII